jgi:hypothetical protein
MNPQSVAALFIGDLIPTTRDGHRLSSVQSLT